MATQHCAHVLTAQTDTPSSSQIDTCTWEFPNENIKSVLILGLCALAKFGSLYLCLVLPAFPLTPLSLYLWIPTMTQPSLFITEAGQWVEAWALVDRKGAHKAANSWLGGRMAAAELQPLPLAEEVRDEMIEESSVEKKRNYPIFMVSLTLLQIGLFIYDHICITSEGRSFGWDDNSNYFPVDHPLILNRNKQVEEINKRKRQQTNKQMK